MYSVTFVPILWCYLRQSLNQTWTMLKKSDRADQAFNGITEVQQSQEATSMFLFLFLHQQRLVYSYLLWCSKEFLDIYQLFLTFMLFRVLLVVSSQGAVASTTRITVWRLREYKPAQLKEGSGICPSTCAWKKTYSKSSIKLVCLYESMPGWGTSSA